jgi:response regulator of citrate/malate metabolism
MTETILIVEDDNADTEIFKAHLKKLDISYNIVFCKKYREAVQHLKNGDTALVFLDLNLPDNWGISTVKDTHSFFKKVPIVCMTSIANDLTVKEATKAGAKDVLIKAFITPDTIQEKINHYCKQTF